MTGIGDRLIFIKIMLLSKSGLTICLWHFRHLYILRKGYHDCGGGVHDKKVPKHDFWDFLIFFVFGTFLPWWKSKKGI